MTAHMQRREFITLLGGAAAAWPLAARAQQPERMRRIGVLSAFAEQDPEIKTRLAAFRTALERLGWSEGRNVRIDYRYAPTAGADLARMLAKELIALQPDVILGQSPQLVAALQRETRALPIVFVSVSDPIGAGFVASLARPGGNLTGLLVYEESITSKWLAMLKEIAPGLARAALLDRVLRGATPGDLPVQAPTKYETVLNLKTAKALGLTVPPGLLVAADEVIE
jgi:putative tryptophan/tyrosine transport system substrate-binding protein